MNFVRLFLLCCVSHFLLIIISCSPSREETDAELNFLEAYVNNSFFEADDVVVMVEDNRIQVIGNNTATKQAIFLIFQIEDKMVYTFGAEVNKLRNEASFYLKEDNNEYSTILINEVCGELRLDDAGKEDGIIAGKFFFEASDKDNMRVRVSSGRFMKKLY